MNQLVCVSHPLCFLLLLLLFCYGFFKLAVCLPYLPDRARGQLQESICLADTLPPSPIHSAGKPAWGRSGSAACTVPPRAVRALE